MNSEEKIIGIVAMVYRECDITEVPIDCQGVIEALGYDLIPYSRLARSKRQACRKISEDAFTAGGAIYYNDTEDFYTRIRFSLMHELGHLLLGHTAEDPFREQEADTFASWMLVPRVDLELCHKIEVSEVAERYDISLTAARYIVNTYDTWFSNARFYLCPGERILTEQLSIKEKMRKKKSEEERRRILKDIYKPRLLESPWSQQRVLKLEPYKPKSETLKGQLRELAKRRNYLKEISQLYGLDFDELMLDQARVDHYYKNVI